MNRKLGLLILMGSCLGTPAADADVLVKLSSGQNYSLIEAGTNQRVTVSCQAEPSPGPTPSPIADCDGMLASQRSRLLTVDSHLDRVSQGYCVSSYWISRCRDRLEGHAIEATKSAFLIEVKGVRSQTLDILQECRAGDEQRALIEYDSLLDRIKRTDMKFSEDREGYPGYGTIQKTPSVDMVGPLRIR